MEKYDIKIDKRGKIMSLFIVNKEKCIRCGACAEVCPCYVIKTDAEKWPVKTNVKTCIACGHCVAVCPTAAIDNRKSPLQEQKIIGEWRSPGKESVEGVLRFRRSIRAYKKEVVENEKIKELMNIARYAQTGGNSQGLSFLVYSGRETLDKISEAVIRWMEDIIATNSEKAPYFKSVVKSYRENGVDTILRGAPNLIVSIAPEIFASARDNTSFTWSYAEIFAPSLGLGTCIGGFAQFCAFSGYESLLEILQLPKGYSVAGVLMVGYPKYTYKRFPERQPLRIEFR